jgi:hypothetical protein
MKQYYLPFVAASSQNVQVASVDLGTDNWGVVALVRGYGAIISSQKNTSRGRIYVTETGDIYAYRTSNDQAYVVSTGLDFSFSSPFRLIEIIRTSSVTTVFVDGVSYGTLSGVTTLNYAVLDANMNIGSLYRPTASSYYYTIDIALIQFEQSNVVVNEWKAESMAGISGSTWTDNVGTNDGTIVNFATNPWAYDYTYVPWEDATVAQDYGYRFSTVHCLEISGYTGAPTVNLTMGADWDNSWRASQYRFILDGRRQKGDFGTNDNSACYISSSNDTWTFNNISNITVNGIAKTGNFATLSALKKGDVFSFVIADHFEKTFMLNGSSSESSGLEGIIYAGIEIIDSNGTHVLDLNQTQGEIRDISGLATTLSCDLYNVPAESGYVRELSAHNGTLIGTTSVAILPKPSRSSVTFNATLKHSGSSTTLFGTNTSTNTTRYKCYIDAAGQIRITIQAGEDNSGNTTYTRTTGVFVPNDGLFHDVQVYQTYGNGCFYTITLDGVATSGLNLDQNVYDTTWSKITNFMLFAEDYHTGGVTPNAANNTTLFKSVGFKENSWDFTRTDELSVPSTTGADSFTLTGLTGFYYREEVSDSIVGYTPAYAYSSQIPIPTIQPFGISVVFKGRPSRILGSRGTGSNWSSFSMDVNTSTGEVSLPSKLKSSNGDYSPSYTNSTGVIIPDDNEFHTLEILIDPRASGNAQWRIALDGVLTTGTLSEQFNSGDWNTFTGFLLFAYERTDNPTPLNNPLVTAVIKSLSFGLVDAGFTGIFTPTDVFDFTTGDVNQWINTLDGTDLTITNPKTSGWMPLVDTQVFTGIDYPLLSSLVTAESNAGYLTKYLGVNSIGATISDFPTGLLIEDGEFTSTVTLTNTGTVNFRSMKMLDVDATGATGDVLIIDSEVQDVTG